MDNRTQYSTTGEMNLMAAAKTGKRIMDAKNDDKDIAYRPTTLA